MADEPDQDATATLLGVNRSFYEAFEAQDLDAMSDLWEHSDRASCTHPGWSALRGWSSIAASWAAIFQGPPLQFILTNEHAEVVGDVAWVNVDENIIGGDQSTTVTALNLFVRDEGGWRMVAHHGSGVVAAQADPS